MTTTLTAPAPRLHYAPHAGPAIHAWLAVEQFVKSSGIEHALLHMMKMRASQINGCAFCLDMHATDAIKEQVPPLKLMMLDAWEEAPNFTERERAALAWTDAVTRVSEDHVPDDVFELVRSQFNDAEIVALTVAIAQINAWNRVSISMRVPPAGTLADKVFA